MQSKSGIHDVNAEFSKQERKLVCWRIQMVGENRVVDGKESLLTWKTNCKCSKMSLKPWIDRE